MMTREEFERHIREAAEAVRIEMYYAYRDALIAHDQAQRDLIEQLQQRLEVDCVYRFDMQAKSLLRVEIPTEDRHKQVDGITARDETIRLMEKKIEQQAKEIQALREALQVWQSLFRQAVSVANGLTNYVGDRPGLHDAERSLERLEQQAQQALKEVS